MKRIIIRCILAILILGVIGVYIFRIIQLFAAEDYMRSSVITNMVSTFVLAIVPLYVLYRNRKDDKAKEEYRTKKEDKT